MMGNILLKNTFRAFCLVLALLIFGSNSISSISRPVSALSEDQKSTYDRGVGMFDVDPCAVNRGSTEDPSDKVEGLEGPVYMLGDSITAGAKNQLTTAFDQAQMASFINGSDGRLVTGNSGGIKAVDTDESQIKDSKIAIIALGTYKEDSAQIFEEKAGELIRKIKNKNDKIKIYWVNIFSNVDNKARYNEILQDLASEKNISIIDTTKANIDLEPGGINPTANGNATFAKTIVKSLSKSNVEYKAVGNIPIGGRTAIASIYGTKGEKDGQGKFVEDLTGIEGGALDESDKPLKGRPVVAELKNNTALGSLPYGTKIEITYKGRSVIAEVSDNGPGEGAREVDLWRQTADLLKFPNDVGRVTVRGVADDTPLTPVDGSAVEDVQKTAKEDGDPSLVCCVNGGALTDENGNPASNQDLELYRSGLPANGPFILEQWAIHVLKAIAEVKQVPESNTVTKQHVLGLLAFALGEGGDINNPQKFNPLNLGGWGEYVDGSGSESGVQSFKSFDHGITPVARQMSIGYQSRLAQTLVKPNSTAEDFLKALTYYDQYPGNAFWAGASVGRQDAYYQERLTLLSTVKSSYESIASLTIGTPGFLDQQQNSRKPELLQFKGDEMTASAGSSQGSGTNCEPPCPPEDSVDTQGAETTPDDWVKLYTGANQAKVNALVKGDLQNPKALLIHYTEGEDEGQRLLDFFYGQRSSAETGIQFNIGKDGKIYQYFPLDDMKMTYHVQSANSRAIGIEITGADGQALMNNSAQFKSVVALSKFLCKKYNIPCGDPKGDITNSSADQVQGMIGHSEAPGNDHHDPDTAYPAPKSESNVINIATGKKWTEADRKDSSKHAYMKKLRTAMGLNPTPGNGSQGGGGEANCVDNGGGGTLVTGSRKELAKTILDSGNITWQTDKSPVQKIVDDQESIVTTPLLRLIASLAQNHKFAISSLVRAGDSGSNHSLGKAVDIGGGFGVDGQPFGYDGINEKAFAFMKDADKFQNEIKKTENINCGMGLPNDQYVAKMGAINQGCTRGLDRGTGAHIHLSVGGGPGGF